MNKPQPIDLPRKKVDRPQIAFNLNEQEARLKESFVKLVGGRGTKPILMEFMRRYVQHNGRIATLPVGENGQTEPVSKHSDRLGLVPRSDDEENLTAAALLAVRDKTTGGANARNVLQAVLGPYIEKVKALRSSRSA